MLPTNATTDPNVRFLRDQLDIANGKIADLNTRIASMEKQKLPKSTLAVYVEDQIERVNARNAELVSRVSDVESNITIIKMGLRYGTDGTAEPQENGGPESREIDGPGWSIKETFVKHGSSSASATAGSKPVIVSSAFTYHRLYKLTVLQTDAGALHQYLEQARGVDTIIDDAYNEKLLRDIFRDLSTLVKDGPYAGYRSTGLLGGYYDDVLAHRNRVIRRLATLEKCAELLKQLKRDVAMAA